MRQYYTGFCFFFNDTATTEIYTLSLHDALPILIPRRGAATKGSFELPTYTRERPHIQAYRRHLITDPRRRRLLRDRKSTRLNSSHANISYAVFCLKKKKKRNTLYLLSLLNDIVI